MARTQKTTPSKLQPQEAAADAVGELIADHRAVARLFAQFHRCKAEGNDEEKQAVVAQICAALTLHTLLEEEIFYPAVREAIEDSDLMDEALVEHAGAKQLIAQLLDASPDDELYDAKVTVLGEQIDHHVTEEEGSMFPQARGAELDLQALGARMSAKRAELEGQPAETQAQPVRAAAIADPVRSVNARGPKKILKKKASASKRRR